MSITLFARSFSPLTRRQLLNTTSPVLNRNLVRNMSTSTTPEKLEIEILSPGDGKTFPKSGDLLTVHYTGTLTNGKKFDSSVERGRPFQFTIGQGMVIQGWEQGFAKLSLGEKARLTVPPLMAYGNRGFPGLIPPMSTLIFDVELLKIN